MPRAIVDTSKVKHPLDMRNQLIANFGVSLFSVIRLIRKADASLVNVRNVGGGI